MSAQTVERATVDSRLTESEIRRKFKEYIWTVRLADST